MLPGRAAIWPRHTLILRLLTLGLELIAKMSEPVTKLF